MNRAATEYLGIVGLILVLAATAWTISRLQGVVDDGQPVLLELRPVDPRSMMQGDYMALRYHQRAFPEPGNRPVLQARGAFVLRLDADDVATFSRLDNGNALADNEVRLKYKQVDDSGRVRLGAESFFFEEGLAPFFADARYGILHVAEDGTSVLVGLADVDRQTLRHTAGEE